MALDDKDIFVVGYDGWVTLKSEPSLTPYQNDMGNSKLVQNDVINNKFGRLLQVTSASVSRATQVPMLNSYYLPFLDADTAKSPIRVGPNLYTFSGELAFEATYGVVDEFFNNDFFSRSSWFWVSFFDGQNTMLMPNCVWSSITITCAPNSLVAMSISFQSNNGYLEELQISNGNANEDIYYDESDLLIPYWTCGHEWFSEFSITFNRSVSPVFLNNDLTVPSYLRPGIVDVSLQATTIEYVENWEDEMDIKIGCTPLGSPLNTHGIKLLMSNLMSKQYNMSSMTDTGAKTYTWNSIAMNAQDSIFEIY